MKRYLFYRIVVLLFFILCIKIVKSQKLKKQKLGIIFNNINPHNNRLDEYLSNILKAYNDYLQQYREYQLIKEIIIKHSYQQSQLLSLQNNLNNKYKAIQKITILHYVQQNNSNQKLSLPQNANPQIQHYFIINFSEYIASYLKYQAISIKQQSHLSFLISPQFILQHFPQYLDLYQNNQTNIAGFLSASFNFNNQGKNFAYTHSKQYYSIVDLNLAFVSKHLINLYFINIPEIHKLRNIVKNKNDCQSILFTIITSHFYLEFIPHLFNNEALLNKSKQNNLQKQYLMLLQGKSKSIKIQHDHEKVAKIIANIQTAKANNQQYKIKDQCFKQMTDTLGYIPLKTYYAQNPFGLFKWKNPSFPIIIRAKQNIYQSILNGNYKINIQNIEQQNKDPQNQQIIQKSITILKHYNIYSKINQKQLQSYIEKSAQFAKEKVKQAITKIKNQNQKRQNNQNAQINNFFLARFIKNDFFMQTLMFIQVVIFFILIYFIWNIMKKQKKYNNREKLPNSQSNDEY